jgi:hypothetical protein
MEIFQLDGIRFPAGRIPHHSIGSVYLCCPVQYTGPRLMLNDFFPRVRLVVHSDGGLDHRLTSNVIKSWQGYVARGRVFYLGGVFFGYFSTLKA